MKTSRAGTSPLWYARAAAILYLLPFAPFSLVYVPGVLVVPGNAAATASHIMASQSLFRLGIVSGLISQLAFLFVGFLLYQLFNPVDHNLAVLMVTLNLVGIPIVMLNEAGQLTIPFLLGAAHPAGFTPDQLNALVSMLLNMHANGLNIAGIFWGLWLFPMGVLVYKSGFLPRVIGVLLIVAGCGYLAQSFAAFLNLDLNLIVYTSWGELALALWLLVRGVNVEQWEKRATEAAQRGAAQPAGRLAVAAPGPRL